MINSLILRKKLSSWLKKQLIINNKKGYIIGVSGGLDSCVIAKLMIDENINFHLIHINYELNAFNEDEKILNYLKNISSGRYSLIDIKDNYTDLFIKTIPRNISFEEKQALNTNSKARIRELIFYNYSKIHEMLVIGTINKVEFNIGYFVKNSSIGDVLPFVNLSKREIRLLGKALNLPAEITRRKASGCVNKRYAEDEWGFTEDEADIFVSNKANQYKIKNSKSILFNKLNKDSQHKREFPNMFIYEEM